MAEPTLVPDAIDRASTAFWDRPDLEKVMAGAEPFRADDSFEIPDLTDDDWAVFMRAVHE